MLAALLLALSCTDDGVQPDDSATDSPVDSADSEDTGEDIDPATVELHGSCPMPAARGRFVVEAYDDYSIVDGRMQDGVVPTTVLTEEAVDGDCRLLRRENPLCDPGCDSDQVCTLDGDCIPYPTDIDLGLVRVDGLSADVEMEGKSPGYHYFDTTIPHPAYVGGELVRLRTEGGAMDPQKLYGVGPQTLDAQDEELVVQNGTPLPVSWNAPEGEVRSRVSLRLTIDQHGSSPLQVQCE